MTREEQIEKDNPYIFGCEAYYAFNEGIEWADEHPHWITDKKPEHNGAYICVLDKDLAKGVNTSDSYYFYDGEWYFSVDEYMRDNPIKNAEVVAWMEFPKFNHYEKT